MRDWQQLEVSADTKPRDSVRLKFHVRQFFAPAMKKLSPWDSAASKLFSKWFDSSCHHSRPNRSSQRFLAPASSIHSLISFMPSNRPD